MENGYDEGKLAGKLSGLAVNEQQQVSSSDNDSNLFQVMKAVEAAEATIKQQDKENIRLKNELQKKEQELEKYKLDEATGKRHYADGISLEQSHKAHAAHSSVPSVSNDMDSIRGTGNTYQPSTSISHMDRKVDIEDTEVHSHTVSHSGDNKMNGTLKELAGGQMIPNSFSMSQLSSPSTTSFSPKRYEVEDQDRHSNFSGQGLMQMAEANTSNHLWKQDLMQKIRQHEEEIMQLRKHLADYSIKESQIRNEKYVLEKRVAYMRLAFDQQQQDLVDAASKALSYRQDIIEENIRLTYALQAAQEERTTFASSLLPLLTEYSLQPPSPDAQSIVSHVKVLFKHLQEKLRQTELKLKEAQYQLTPWRADINHSNMAPPSPSHSLGAAANTPNKDGLELVPRPTFTHEKMPMSTEAASDWDILNQHQSALSVGMIKNREPDDIGRYSPLVSRNPAVHDSPAQIAVSHADRYSAQYGEESSNRQVTFREPVSHNEMDDYDAYGQQNEQEHQSNWAPGSSPYSTAHQDQTLSYSPYLPPVPEDPSSSYSEAADDDPLPGIDDLQISGYALPGHKLEACGFSINGTTSCNFEWIRHLEDGSVNYIEGAKQPNYIVTADDVNTCLAIQVQPLDDRKRKGELVRVFANEHQKIPCDPEMQRQIEKNFNDGQVSYKVSVPTGYLDIWEPGTLAIKREGYSIKCSGSSGDVTEKFTRDTRVEIPYGQPAEFVIVDSDGGEHLLRTEINADISCWRDTIVLTMRLFIMRAGEKRKGRKKSLFFHK